MKGSGKPLAACCLCLALAGLQVVRADNLAPLYTWYSSTRGDYFTTSDPAWRAAIGTLRPGAGDYVCVRREGQVFSPDRPQPPDTVPLYHWWSESRKDNFLTTNPAWSGAVGRIRPGQGDYRLFRIEGYIFISPLAGTVSLHSFWNSERNDNYASASPELDGSVGGYVPPHLAGYRRYRTEGHLIAESGDNSHVVASNQELLTRRFGLARLQPSSPALPVLVIMNEWADVSFTRHTAADYRSLVRTGFPSINSIATAASGNRLRIDLLGVIEVRSSWTAAAAGARTGPELRRHALSLANGEVDFRRFDYDRNGRVTPTELQVIRFVPSPTVAQGGQNGYVEMDLDGVRVGTNVQLVAEDTGITGLFHELLHTYRAEDIYGPGRMLNQRVSTMAAMPDASQLIVPDAWHRMQLGWMSPEVFSIRTRFDGGGAQVIRLRRGPNTRGVLLFDPEHANEFFMLEYRDNRVRMDNGVPGSGLLIWQVLTDGDRRLRTIVRRDDRDSTVAWPGGPVDLTDNVQGALAVGDAAGRRLGGPRLFTAADPFVLLRWFGEAAQGVRVRVMDATELDLLIEWRSAVNPRPMIFEVTPETTRPGRTVVLTGRISDLDLARYRVSLSRSGRRYLAPLSSVHGFGIRFSVPSDVLPGEYDIAIVYTVPGLGSGSNRLKLRIE